MAIEILTIRDCSRANSIQFSELYISDLAQNSLGCVGGDLATDPSFPGSIEETISKVCDSNENTKWLDFNMGKIF